MNLVELFEIPNGFLNLRLISTTFSLLSLGKSKIFHFNKLAL